MEKAKIKKALAFMAMRIKILESELKVKQDYEIPKSWWVELFEENQRLKGYVLKRRRNN